MGLAEMSFDAVNKPWFQPPSWVFGPIWLILYASMLLSIVLAWNDRDKIPTEIFIFFVFQLALNLMWSSFFDDSDYFLSFAIIIGMVAFSLAYVVLIYPYNQTASLVLVPYVLWISFASIINAWYYLEG